MVIDIKSFLVPNEAEEKEVKIDRFPEPFVVVSISEKENDKLKKAATVTRRNKSGNLTKDLDTDKYTGMLLARSVKVPDLKK